MMDSFTVKNTQFQIVEHLIGNLLEQVIGSDKEPYRNQSIWPEIFH
jgi:hypothetical protein